MLEVQRGKREKLKGEERGGRQKTEKTGTDDRGGGIILDLDMYKDAEGQKGQNDTGKVIQLEMRKVS